MFISRVVIRNFIKGGRWFQNDLTTHYKGDRLFVCHDNHKIRGDVGSKTISEARNRFDSIQKECFYSVDAV